MSLERQIAAALNDLACPGWATDRMLGALDASVVRLYGRILATKSQPLPDTQAARQLATHFSITFETVRANPGVHALAVYEVDGQRVGAVRRLVCHPDRVEARDAFIHGCHMGELAALRWVQEHVGLFDPRPLTFHLSVLEPLAEPVTPHDRVGHSAGLAAAIAAAVHWLGAGTLGARAIAATGEVDATGRVRPVEAAYAKLQALAREAPEISLVFVPRANLAAVADLATGDLEIVGVDSVAEALDHALGSPGQSQLALIDPVGAADLALEYEVGKDNPRALAIAERIETTLENLGLDDYERYRAGVIARTVIAANRVHAGQADRAQEQFAAIDALRASMDDGLREDVFSALVQARLSAIEASAWIDLLEPARAVESCERVESLLSALDDKEARLSVLGSFTRALTALDRLDEAETRSDQQLAVRLAGIQKRQEPHSRCNRIALLLRRYNTGDADALARAREQLVTARAANDALPDSTARERNNAFLDLWAVRIAAEAGDLDGALALRAALPIEPGGFPDLYLHRFVAEALEQAGRTDEALARLDAMASSIGHWCGPFERLVLSTALARKACILIDHALPNWQQPAQQFFELLTAWKADFASPPALERQHASTVRHCLEDVLARLPY